MNEESTDAEIDELVSHVLALRKDYVQSLLKVHGVVFSGLRKPELREQLREAIGEGRITAEQVVAFLDEAEPGGKQHVFLLRARRALNNRWLDATAVRRRLGRRRELRAVLDGVVPLLMPERLELSRVRLEGSVLEITAVEARRYTERDPTYDQETTTEDGLPVELHAHVQHVARSVVLLRWDTATRHAALHITQASGRGLPRGHYADVKQRFADVVEPWLDLSQFRDLNLRRAVSELHRRERDGQALTRSPRGRWETSDGGEMEAVSASTGASLYADERLKRAVSEVEDEASSQSGSFYWLPGGAENPLTDELHISILAFESRVNFMVPSSAEVVEHVINEIRSLR